MLEIGINSSGGGADNGIVSNGIIEKNYTLNISNKIKDILSNYDIKVYMIRDKDETISYSKRIEDIYKNIKSGSIILSNTLNDENGISIIYSVNKDDNLASMLASNLSKYNSVKYYQYKWSVDTTKDFYLISRETPNYNTIIIRYGNPSNSKDASILKNNINELASTVANTLISYLKLTKKTNSEPISYYIVKSGDTIYSIARRFNTTVDKIKSLNGLSSNLIKINQKLLLPTNTYKVVKGDTLYSIAKKYNTTVNKLKEINNLSSDNLQINTILYLT